jgi:small subunit ribosomal protein S5
MARDSFVEDSGLQERVVAINRVAKVVKGGRRFGFNALVVVGDGAGSVGYGLGKANEVALAVNKGVELAKKSLMEIPIIDGTIPHAVVTKYGGAKVMIRPALAGVHNILTKSFRSNNPHNVIKATLKALEELKHPDEAAIRKGLEVKRAEKTEKKDDVKVSTRKRRKKRRAGEETEEEKGTTEPAAPDVEPAAPDVEPAAPDVEPAAPDVEPAAPGVEPAATDGESAAPDIEPAEKVKGESE